MLHLKKKKKTTTTLMRGAHATVFPSVTAKVAKGTMNTSSAEYGSLHCTARSAIDCEGKIHKHTHQVVKKKKMVALSPYQSTVPISLAVCFVNVDITSNVIYV